MKRRTRTRISAAALMVEELLLRLDAYLAACLDTRPLAARAIDAAAWLGQTWRRHLSTARIRAYGPGRGVVAVVINRPTPEKESHREF